MNIRVWQSSWHLCVVGSACNALNHVGVILYLIIVGWAYNALNHVVGAAVCDALVAVCGVQLRAFLIGVGWVVQLSWEILMSSFQCSLCHLFKSSLCHCFIVRGCHLLCQFLRFPGGWCHHFSVRVYFFCVGEDDSFFDVRSRVDCFTHNTWW